MSIDDEARELRDAVAQVVNSNSKKKLVIAGPGAGKTFLFKRLLETQGGDPKRNLVITFVNNLRDDLEASLGGLARVFTLHGYCQFLLHQHEELREDLRVEFVCRPRLMSLIKSDWEWLQETHPPELVKLMRQLDLTADQYAFYLSRSNYYNAVDFDDSVYRVYNALSSKTGPVPEYDLVLIDEFQDFNKLEASVVGLLGDDNAIVVAGDDDQVLYSSLRQADSGHIRERHKAGVFDVFYLPFCMRCPKVIVDAVASIFQRATAIGALQGRIDKPYRYCELVKGEDSRANPQIDLVRASVQRFALNYFGRYVEQYFKQIPPADLEKASADNEPALLVIGSKPYLPQIEAYLVNSGLLETTPKLEKPQREEALEILARDPESNLGWRIILACGDAQIARNRVRTASANKVPLGAVFPDEERETILSEAKAYVGMESAVLEKVVSKIKLTSFEGSKGLSAQHVFLVGVHESELPRSATKIADLEICRFLVGLTRTKKKCTILNAYRFGDAIKNPSVFLSWIGSHRFNLVTVNAAYWKG